MARYIIFTPLFFCFYAVDNVLAASPNVVYDSCFTPERESGHCIVINRCPSLWNLLVKPPVSEENKQRLKQSHCGFQGKFPKVCCSLNDVDSSTEQPLLTSSRPPLFGKSSPISDLLPSTDSCGRIVEERLFFGDTTLIHHYPWTILLEYEKPNGRGIHCGGALINNRYVLTAAHCVSEANLPKNWNLVGVQAGEYNLTTDPDCEIWDCGPSVSKIKIEEKIVHEHYDPSNLNRYYDIALLRLAHNVTFIDTVEAICLQPTAQNLRNISGIGDSGTITGWGITAHGYEIDQKSQTKMQIKDNAECELKYGVRTREDQFCASGEKACYGDDGGTLFYQNHVNDFRFLNNFAYGVQAISNRICSDEKSPIVYTKVESFVPWIISKLKP